MSQPSLEYLNKIREDRQNEAKRLEMCRQLKICPCCGANLIDENLEKFDKPKSYLFGLIKKKTKYWDRRIVCPNDKKHFEEKENFHFEGY